ncbi:ABC transporter permease subunit [Peptoniphilus equinus]|uniref:ABC transporter permease subunit n=1 Tax=Peptoniphilus equinus TaxID=3016343 RepID=A0ABY7QX41_9FIRM|nr:ABC transporter permease subunit [Peptoniphilus equinus]WBW50665.1 ABC transporter permease subunit [Peptoniphilus equinus]
MIFSREFKYNTSKLFAWLVVIGILAGLLLATYPIMLDGNMKSIFDSFVGSMSPKTASVLGLQQMDYGDPSQYTAFIYQYLAVFLVMFAMQLGASALAREQSSGSIEYIYSNPISRSEIVSGKFFANLLSYLILMILLGVCSFFVMMVLTRDNGAIDSTTFIYDLVKIFGSLFLSGFVFMTIGMFFSALSRSATLTDATSVLFVLLIVIATVFGKLYGGVLTTVVTKFPMEVFSPVKFLMEEFSLTDIGINVVVAVLFMLLTYLIYNSKELNY